jgi:hypothetical protein
MTPPSDVGQAARDLAAEPRIVVQAAATPPAARHHTTGSARPTPSTGSSPSRKRRGTPTTRGSSTPPTTAATSYIPAPPAIRRCQRHQPAHARALRDGTGDGLIGVAQAARTLRSATTSASRAAVARGTWSLQPHNPLPRARGASAKRWSPDLPGAIHEPEPLLQHPAHRNSRPSLRPLPEFSGTSHDHCFHANGPLVPALSQRRRRTRQRLRTPLGRSRPAGR